VGRIGLGYGSTSPPLESAIGQPADHNNQRDCQSNPASLVRQNIERRHD
jgi:hypothetical protein